MQFSYPVEACMRFESAGLLGDLHGCNVIVGVVLRLEWSGNFLKRLVILPCVGPV